MHVASALGSEGVGHVTHEAAVPHWSVLSFGKHPLVAGQVWVPAPHTTPQAAFTQAVQLLEPVGARLLLEIGASGVDFPLVPLLGGAQLRRS